MKIIAYLRVSTKRQAVSGLGLEAQREAIDRYARERGAEVVNTYTETESGKRTDRPQLERALRDAKAMRATLVIAKLDRLSRNARFLLELRDSGVRFVAADMPDANNLTVTILAAVAEQEREAISRRTREALAAAKRRGVRLGNPNGAAALHRARKGNRASLEAIQVRAHSHAEGLRHVVAELAAEGIVSLGGIAAALNARGYPTPRDSGKWHKSTVKNLLARLEG